MCELGLLSSIKLQCMGSLLPYLKSAWITSLFQHSQLDLFLFPSCILFFEAILSKTMEVFKFLITSEIQQQN